MPLTWATTFAPTGKPDPPLTVSPIEISPVVDVVLTVEPNEVTVLLAEVVAALRADLATTLGVEASPTAVRLGRFPDSLVQFPVGHVDRITDLDGLLADETPGLLVTGTVLNGVGIPACIRSGTEAAEAAVAAATR